MTAAGPGFKLQNSSTNHYTEVSITSARSILVSSLFAVCCALPAHAITYSPPVTDAEGNVYTIEKEGMTRKGYIVHAWQLVNLATPKDGGVRSTRSLVEFNCRFRQTRTMWVSEHAERDAGGEPTKSGQVDNPEWVTLEPGALKEKLLDFSCSHIMR